MFCSSFPDPLAWGCDALVIEWSRMFANAFTPPILILKILNKIEQEPCVLLIAPFSLRQAWLPDLLKRVIDYPREQPVINYKLVNTKRRQFIHSSPESLQLIVLENFKGQEIKNRF